MSENNGARTRTLGYEKFFKVAEALKKNKDQFLTGRPTLVKAARELSRLCGFQVPASAVPQAQNVTGVKWESKRGPTDNSGRSARIHACRTLAVAVRDLCIDLGKKPTQALESLYHHLTGRGEAGPEQPAEGGKNGAA
jgi:hypothetical protein